MSFQMRLVLEFALTKETKGNGLLFVLNLFTQF